MSETPENLPPGLTALQLGVQVVGSVEELQESLSEADHGMALEVITGADGEVTAALLRIAGMTPRLVYLLLESFAEVLDGVEGVHAPGCDCGEEVDIPVPKPEHRLVHDESGSPACACGWTPDREDRANGNGLGSVAVHIAVAGMAE